MQQQNAQQPPPFQSQNFPPSFYGTPAGNVPMQTYVPPAGYVTVQTLAAGDPSIVHLYNSRHSKIVGVSLIVIGILSFIFNGIGFGVGDFLAPVGHGFWCGALFILTGSFGVAASSKRRCLIIAFMILAIMSANITIFLFGFGVTGAVSGSSCRGCHDNYYHGHCRSCSSAAMVMEAFLASLSLLAAIMSIWGSVICCQTVCCCAPAYNGMVVATPYGNQQMVIATQPNTQFVATSQLVRPQVVPATAGVPQTYVMPSGYAAPQQYWPGPSAQQPMYPQQQQQQQFGHGYASAPEIPAGAPPPAYSAVDHKGSAF